MELKLQQAIVATRAGRTDVAQSLLAQLIRDNPKDANAWFLLGHIVDSPERRALYLHKTLELQPEHTMARKQLMQLQNEAVPAVVLPRQPAPREQKDAHEATTQLDQRAIAAAAAVVSSQQTPPVTEAASAAPSSSNSTTTALAGRPIREKKAPETQRPPQTVAEGGARPSETAAEDKASGEVWLVRILVLMVIIAAIVLGILVLLIMI